MFFNVIFILFLLVKCLFSFENYGFLFNAITNIKNKNKSIHEVE